MPKLSDPCIHYFCVGIALACAVTLHILVRSTHGDVVTAESTNASRLLALLPLLGAPTFAVVAVVTGAKQVWNPHVNRNSTLHRILFCLGIFAALAASAFSVMEFWQIQSNYVLEHDVEMTGTQKDASYSAGTRMSDMNVIRSMRVYEGTSEIKTLADGSPDWNESLLRATFRYVGTQMDDILRHGCVFSLCSAAAVMVGHLLWGRFDSTFYKVEVAEQEFPDILDTMPLGNQVAAQVPEVEVQVPDQIKLPDDVSKDVDKIDVEFVQHFSSVPVVAVPNRSIRVHDSEEKMQEPLPDENDSVESVSKPACIDLADPKLAKDQFPEFLDSKDDHQRIPLHVLWKDLQKGHNC